MQLSGYADTGLPIEQVVHSTLAEITLCATPAELRRIAEFSLFVRVKWTVWGQVMTTYISRIR